MNKLSTILGAVIVLFAVACEGPQGPPGYDGLDGLDGLDGADGIQGQVVEVEGVNFGYDAGANLFSSLITFSDITNFEVFESDAVLVYRYVGSIPTDDGGTADLWSQIPQNYFLDEGTIQYVFEHTFIDLELFIDGNFDLSTLSTDFTDDQIFRIVFIPSEYAEASRMDTSNIQNVMSSLGIEEEKVLKLNLN
ncbi:MAG: collagen-like protein [Muricauda sp.]|nr:collagen-like protein [Allomuricauda sp.]